MSTLETSVKSGTYRIIRTDETSQTIQNKPTIRELRKAIGADCMDSVNLRNGCVMMVDDTGMIDHKPVNPEATQIYHLMCKPGAVHSIHGDAVIVFDEDFA